MSGIGKYLVGLTSMLMLAAGVSAQSQSVSGHPSLTPKQAPEGAYSVPAPVDCPVRGTPNQPCVKRTPDVVTGGFAACAEKTGQERRLCLQSQHAAHGDCAKAPNFRMCKETELFRAQCKNLVGPEYMACIKKLKPLTSPP